ncbi:unnamed protein product, partial [marine sediment metagenome]
MLYKVLEKSVYDDFIKALISEYEFIGPKKKDRSVHDFVIIKDISELDTNYMRTTIPPAKKLLFPPNEELVAYEIGKKIEVRPVVEGSEKILFGVNAWDINGMNFLDRVFTTDFIDENYISKRKKLIVIGMDIEPTETNFSMSMGAEYAKDGVSINVNKRRIYMDTEEDVVYSVNTQYGGNTIGHKKLAMRLGINRASKENWLTEHMFISGIHSPGGRVTYFAGAFPSMCGKTSTATI